MHAAQRNAGAADGRSARSSGTLTESSLERMSVKSRSALAHMCRCCDVVEVERAGDVSREKLIAL